LTTAGKLLFGGDASGNFVARSGDWQSLGTPRLAGCRTLRKRIVEGRQHVLASGDTLMRSRHQ
jgi:hypothetical protein